MATDVRVKDAGEIILGARKFIGEKGAIRLANLRGIPPREAQKMVTKASVFPVPDYVALAAEFDRLKPADAPENYGAGMAWVIKTIRDSLPSLDAAQKEISGGIGHISGSRLNAEQISQDDLFENTRNAYVDVVGRICDNCFDVSGFIGHAAIPKPGRKLDPNRFNMWLLGLLRDDEYLLGGWIHWQDAFIPYPVVGKRYHNRVYGNLGDLLRRAPVDAENAGFPGGRNLTKLWDYGSIRHASRILVEPHRIRGVVKESYVIKISDAGWACAEDQLNTILAWKDGEFQRKEDAEQRCAEIRRAFGQDDDGNTKDGVGPWFIFGRYDGFGNAWTRRYIQDRIDLAEMTKTRFETKDEAIADAWKQFDSIQAEKRKAKKDPKEGQGRFNDVKIPPLDHIKREGPDHRGGRDVTAEDLRLRFGFRGVQFGLWNDGEFGQASLNHAWDALSDLADVMGINPEAIGLDGSLGLAFGARGSGRAAAHYECAQRVINLTKTAGAGALAHEWAHALDDYLATRAGLAEQVPFLSGFMYAYRKSAAATTAAKAIMRSAAAEAGITASVEAFTKVMAAIQQQRVPAEPAIAAYQGSITKKIQGMRGWEDSFSRGVGKAIQEKNKSISPGDALEIGRAEAEKVGDAVEASLRAGQSGMSVLIDAMGNMRAAGLDARNISKAVSGMRSWMPDILYEVKAVKAIENAIAAAKGDFNAPTVESTLPVEVTQYSMVSKKKGEYWDRPHEKFARAFECWVVDQLAVDGRANDYLVHPRKQALTTKEIAAYAEKDGGAHPESVYPQGIERKVINRRFNDLREAIRSDNVFMANVVALDTTAIALEDEEQAADLTSQSANPAISQQPAASQDAAEEAPSFLADFGLAM